MALTPNTPPFVSGAILTAQQMTNLPMGTVALTNTTTQTITSSYLVGVNTTFTFVANRNYRISFSGPFNTTAGSYLVSIEVNGADVNRIYDSRPTGATSTSFYIVQGFYASTIAAGSKTVKIKVTTLAGVVTNSAAADIPNILLIEDIGTA